MNLVEWIKEFVKYKDSVMRRIKDIDTKENYVLVHMKDGSTHKYLCVSGLKTLDLKSLDDERLVCYNTKENINWIINNWELLKDSKIMFYFVNIDKMESWALSPRLHHGVSDKDSLKTGLMTLFESVPEVK